MLPADDWEVTLQPDELLHVFGTYGLRPDAKIRNRHTDKVFYFETKFQGPRGNAEERAAKLFTRRFVEFFKVVTGMPYHAYAVVFMGNLATDKRYTNKFPYLYYSDEYCCWQGKSNIYTLQDFVWNRVIRKNRMEEP